jgi:dephospho-CoA kinase
VRLVIGLTGGLASGKTTVAKIFEQLGAKVVDADLIARDILKKGTKVFRKIVEAFGDGIIGKEGEVDRKKLADIIFHDEEARKRLNAITHPPIRRRIVEEIARLKRSANVIILDVPLLIEAGFTDLVDVVIVVNAREEQQVKRLMSRNRMTKEEALLRIRTQLSMSTKLNFADYVIDNNGSLDKTKENVKMVWKKLCKD